MKGKRRLVFVCAVAALVFAAGARAHAEDASPATSVPTAASLRQDFNVSMDNLDRVFERTQSERGRQLVAQAKERMAAVTDDELTRTFARRGFPDLGPLVSAARGLAGAVDRSGTRPRTPGLPGAPGILGACGGVVHDSSFTFGALIALQVARAIIAAAQYACEEVVVVVGEGGNGSLACIPLAIAADAAAIPYELASFCAGEEDSAVLQGSYDRLGHIHGDIEAARLDVINNDDSNRTEILNNANANATTILNSGNANTTSIINNSNSNTASILASLGANADQAEARQIEDDLAHDSCPAWMYTPEYADVANTVRLGGRFEKVVKVIQGVIDNARALQSVKRFELACAQDSLDDAVRKAAGRPPFRSERICDLLLDAYEKVTPPGEDHGHGHPKKDHDQRDHPGRHADDKGHAGTSLTRPAGVPAAR